MKNVIFTFFIKWFWLGVEYFNRPDAEVDYFHSENDLEVTFWTTPQSNSGKRVFKDYSFRHSDLHRREKLVSRAHVGVETDFRAGVGRNAERNNV